MRPERGQSTVEYVALALVAVAVLAAGAAGLHATGIASALIAQMQRALCRLDGGDCRRAPEPCVVASTTTIDDVSVRLAVLRLRGGRTLLRERRSDGSERITLIARGGGGAGAALGGELRIGSRAAGGRLDAAIEARGGRGRTWAVPSIAAGDALLRALGARAAPPSGRMMAVARRPRRAAVPEPDVVFGERSLSTAVSGALQRIGLSFEAEDLAGSRTDTRSGERTLVVRRRNELLGSLGVIGAEGSGRRDERAALVVDARGRPLRLVLGETRRLQGGVKLPGALRSLLARGGLPQRRGHVLETERALDLGDPANLAAASAFVRALRDPGLRADAALAVSGSLRRRLDAAGRSSLRAYALDVRHSGARAGVDAGVGVGGGYEHSVEQARLVAASERDGRGPWRERGDCLVGA